MQSSEAVLSGRGDGEQQSIMKACIGRLEWLGRGMGTQLAYVTHFKDLEVYRKQRAFAREVFNVSKRFPPEERYSLSDQLRRASRSIGSQIAEAWAKRLYPKHFISKLSDADGEQMESQHWLMEARDCGYLEPAQEQRLLDLCEEIGRMLGGMIQKAEAFSSNAHRLHEQSPPYLETKR